MINLIDPEQHRFFGYPYCWSEHTLPAGRGAGTHWADESPPSELRKTDAYCQDSAQVQAPAFVMPAHWAPLGVAPWMCMKPRMAACSSATTWAVAFCA